MQDCVFFIEPHPVSLQLYYQQHKLPACDVQWRHTNIYICIYVDTGWVDMSLA